MHVASQQTMQHASYGLFTHLHYGLDSFRLHGDCSDYQVLSGPRLYHKLVVCSFRMKVQIRTLYTGTIVQHIRTCRWTCVHTFWNQSGIYQFS